MNLHITAKEYKAVNWALIWVFILMLLYPLVSVGAGVNIKTCGKACKSCGVTRDIYNLLQLTPVDKPLNKNTNIFLGLILCQLPARIVYAAFAGNALYSTIAFDLLTTSATFFTIYNLFNN